MSELKVNMINSPQFIDLTPLDINPLMSKCNIKVLYTGMNRNGSFITKDVATEMSKTLRGAPIVGHYRDEKGDFTDHGEVVTIDDQGFHLDCATVPYGFVAPDAQVWFQEFEEEDVFGISTTREYLMTEGYLWTGQFEEAKLAIEGRPQSMELDADTLDGNWQYNSEKNMDFFIINDATFSKLCILGNDVEPCFEGANIAAPISPSNNFNKIDNKFTKTLYTMMKDLEQVLSEGGQMTNEMMEPVVETEFENQEPSSVEENFEAQEEEIVEEEFALEEEEKEEEEEEETSDETSEEEDNEEEEEKEDKYALLEAEHAELLEKFALLEEENKALNEFKAEVENKQKDELINSFYMLSDEDKKDVVENKANYTLDEIEAKLSVICVRNKVSFSQEEETNEPEPAVTFNVVDGMGESVPAYIQSMRNIRK